MGCNDLVPDAVAVPCVAFHGTAAPAAVTPAADAEACPRVRRTAVEARTAAPDVKIRLDFTEFPFRSGAEQKWPYCPHAAAGNADAPLSTPAGTC
ncbi:hypothetical protein HEK616_30720 [Streptomyces nigrescens]|uniref:Uncharacterized protein n=1 Tax=Streptomyces nigrescens TaxID=1920 RepID=A0ABN6QWI1_STRNI|nr:hypothetical protein HEK616_30720 [Streptomyces nigrescens]